MAASAGLMLAPWTWAESTSDLALCWKLEEAGDSALETVSGAPDAISSRTSHAIWVETGRDRALRLDGYSVWIDHAAKELPLRSGLATISAWLALESYPVNEAAVLHIGGQPNAEISLTIDRWGFAQFKVQRGPCSSACKSAQPVPKAKWIHLAATFGESGTAVFCDGVPCGRGPGLKNNQGGIGIIRDAVVTLAKSPQSPVIAGVFPTGLLNGLMREVRVFDAELSSGTIAGIEKYSRPENPPDLQINGPWCVDDPQRPIYHAIPPRAWTNEPHGLVQWRGQYHLFYQKNPSGPYWGHIHWGHMTSPDLFRWTEMPVALSPEPGPDAEGCWSGSAIEHEGKLAIIYTGGDGTRSSICLALSDDGIHFTKHPGNPIIPQPPPGHGFPEFRDPFVWREGDGYCLIIGSAITDVGGAALLYRSKDLIEWEYRKPLLVGDRETSGVFWEMPVFVKLGDQHALIVCEVPGRASYWVGNWSGETFTPHSEAPQRLELFNHLLSPTPLVLGDDRAIAMGIIPDERSPKECWRAGWAHHYSLPRLISADERGRLHQSVFEGIGHWSEPIMSLTNLGLPDGSMLPIEQASGTHLHVRVLFKRGDSHSVTLRIRSSPDGQEHTDIHYQWDIGRLVLDRTHASLDRPGRRDNEDATWFPDTRGTLELIAFLDESAIEVFIDQRSAFAAHVYPTLPASTGIFVGSQGGAAKIEMLNVARIRRPA